MRALTVIGLCCFLGTVMIWSESHTSRAAGRSSPPQVDVAYRFQEGISLHEPVVVIFSVHNGLSQPITLTLGSQSQQYFQFSLTTPQGHALQSYRNPGEDVDLVIVGSGKVEVVPGGDYEQPLLMNQWFKFDTAGTYVLTSQLTTNIDVAGDASLQPQGQTIRLIIKPRDARRLEEVCDELAKQVLTAKDEEAREPALKLSYIDDPIAVRYMAHVLSHHMFDYELVVRGLERMGDEAAVEVLLSALGDSYGDIAALARRALTRLQSRISSPNLKETVRRALEKEPPPSSQ
jgi:hypothetical protein